MKIIAAPNAFKGSLSAYEAAVAIRKGLRSSGHHDVVLLPVSDGGEGFTDILVRQLDGRLVNVEAVDPIGRKIQTAFGVIHDEVAVIELANASGMKWLHREELDPLQASTYGTGMLMKHALDAGLRDMVVGLGNSATVDGGMGVLRALGVVFTDELGQPLSAVHELIRLHDIDLSNIDPRLDHCRITVACDVENFLLGASGAAQVFAPQKGAGDLEVELLERCLTRLSKVVSELFHMDLSAMKYGGAAGGVSAALAAFLQAKLVSGIDYLAEHCRFAEAMEGACLLITGEGSIDSQTLSNKGPYGVARLAKEKGLSVIALAGQMPAALPPEQFAYFDVLLPIATGPVPLSDAIASTALNLERTAAQVGRMLRLRLLTGEGA